MEKERKRASTEGREKGSDGQGERERASIEGREHMHPPCIAMERRKKKLQH
jgi:hypothetical protein